MDEQPPLKSAVVDVDPRTLHTPKRAWRQEAEDVLAGRTVFVPKSISASAVGSIKWWARNLGLTDRRVLRRRYTHEGVEGVVVFLEPLPERTVRPDGAPSVYRPSTEERQAMWDEIAEEQRALGEDVR